ncbi:SOS regulatory protein LexA [Rubidibacter lacunae KORDI 51-2]|uniref:LexA repressor n=1 Tax=Rubidibacter lacunae KORDI 51-2 TaxID=582515 RepID=U5D9F1_9CHRO|nr:transcriptional repressor LexA [Rubidibacter lacunae]ERN41218.1 SOS regulatory protein LexA [Rubidibacter lacunae KORDI 51-2]
MEPLTKAQQELYDWLVDYIQSQGYAPSIRQMMRAMNLKSPAPIQSRLERLRSKGYINWQEGKARTIRILQPPESGDGVPIMGAIAAGGVVEQFTDCVEHLDLAGAFQQTNCFALRVVGDSMIDDCIAEGDYAIMKRGREPQAGDIVAARVAGIGTTLKRLYFSGDKAILKASNPNYDPIEVPVDNLEVQGVLAGVWRDYNGNSQRQW